MLGIFFVCYFVFWVSVEAGLPNVTGTFQSYGESDTVFLGAFSKNTTLTRGTAGGQGLAYLANFNASNSSSTYQDNAPVRPLSITTAFLIRY